MFQEIAWIDQSIAPKLGSPSLEGFLSEVNTLITIGKDLDVKPSSDHLGHVKGLTDAAVDTDVMQSHVRHGLRGVHPTGIFQIQFTLGVVVCAGKKSVRRLAPENEDEQGDTYDDQPGSSEAHVESPWLWEGTGKDTIIYKKSR